MPYKDPEKQKAYKREWERQRTADAQKARATGGAEIRTSELAAIVETNLTGFVQRLAESQDNATQDAFLAANLRSIAYAAAAQHALKTFAPGVHDAICAIVVNRVHDLQGGPLFNGEQDGGEDIPGFLGHVDGAEA